MEIFRPVLSACGRQGHSMLTHFMMEVCPVRIGPVCTGSLWLLRTSPVSTTAFTQQQPLFSLSLLCFPPFRPFPPCLFSLAFVPQRLLVIPLFHSPLFSPTFSPSAALKITIIAAVTQNNQMNPDARGCFLARVCFPSRTAVHIFETLMHLPL